MTFHPPCAVDGAQIAMWLCLGGMLGLVVGKLLGDYERPDPPE